MWPEIGNHTPLLPALPSLLYMQLLLLVAVFAITLWLWLLLQSSVQSTLGCPPTDPVCFRQVPQVGLQWLLWLLIQPKLKKDPDRCCLQCAVHYLIWIQSVFAVPATNLCCERWWLLVKRPAWYDWEHRLSLAMVWVLCYWAHPPFWLTM